jgi:hypothetical protein
MWRRSICSISEPYYTALSISALSTKLLSSQGAEAKTDPKACLIRCCEEVPSQRGFNHSTKQTAILGSFTPSRHAQCSANCSVLLFAPCCVLPLLERRTRHVVSIRTRTRSPAASAIHAHRLIGPVVYPSSQALCCCNLARHFHLRMSRRRHSPSTLLGGCKGSMSLGCCLL